MLETKTIGQFGFDYTVDHLGTFGGKDAVLITLIFDQMPLAVLKKAQNEFLYEFSGINVHFRIPWSKVILKKLFPNR
jgi:hypothetical protein|tara:strand:+ start:203 stop:433 length:231 start_codon:yes stop_codon:yes gene_type:complete